jgi:hypothetical protein
VKIRIYIHLLLLGSVLIAVQAVAQEHIGHTDYNPFVNHKAASLKNNHRKTTAATPLNLPFFEDFTGYGVYPDSTRWTDFEVYINNTMCVSPIARGVATFDALNRNGIPYDSFSNTNFRYADSLTSQPINLDLGLVNPGDSVYFSFFYQPQGNGFYPVGKDSLMLFFRTRFGGFLKVWSAPGTALQPFRQVMIPITDSIYFDSFFQFRFVNIAALDWADAVWNLDYIRFDKNRSLTDTAVNDAAISSNPSFLLNDYTSMPYRQFYANRAGESASQYTDSIHNNYPVFKNVSFNFSARALNNGAVLQPSTSFGSLNAPPFSIEQLIFPSYSVAITPPTSQAKVVFENTFFINPVTPADPSANDTIVSNQVFDNYLAYDDGSAEKSYYLNLYPTLPGKVAIEYHLNQPDTMLGMAIYFGRQIPFPGYKYFSIAVYSALAGVNGYGADNLLYQQDLCSPTYADTINHFWYYAFDNPVHLPAGTFYAGTIQPAESASDSLYFGLDVNRIGGNHAYYNVLSAWNPSLIAGAIMMRPLLGQRLSVGIKNTGSKGWKMYPNPANDLIKFDLEGDIKVNYTISDITGHKLLNGAVSNGTNVDISSLTPGMYFVNITGDGFAGEPQKLVKL